MCMVAFCCVLLTGCGRNPADIEILSGVPVVEVNDSDTQPYWSSVRAKITFEDGTQETVTGDDMVFSHLDVSTPGKKTVTVGYKEGSFRKEIEVIVVDSATVSATVSGYTGTYDGESHDICFVTGLLSDDRVSYSLDNGTTWLTTCPQVKNAGTTTFSVKVEREKYGTLIDTKTYTSNATVEKKLVEVRGKKTNLVYGDAVPATFDFEIVGLVGGDTVSSLTTAPQSVAQIKDTDKKDGKLKVGTYNVVFSGAEATNYTFSYTNGTIVVEKATFDMSNVRWNETNIEYEAGVQKEVYLVGLPTGCKATYTGNTATEIGSYTATATLVYDAENYNAPTLPQGVELTHNWTIAENVNYIKVAMPQALTTVFTYNGQAQTYTPTGFDTTAMAISNHIQTNAGEYTVTVSLNSGYAWADAEKGKGKDPLTFTFVIGKRTVELEWGTTSLTYTGEAQKPNVRIKNLCGNDVCNLTVTGEQTNANKNKNGEAYDPSKEYTATVTGIDNNNYELPTTGTTTQFDILQATNNWTTIPTLEISLVNGQLVESRTGGAKFGFENVKYYYKEYTADDSTYSETVPQTSGEYMMKAVIAEANNYTGLEITCKFYVDSNKIESMNSKLLDNRKSILSVETAENFVNKKRPIFAGQQNYFDFQMIGNGDKSELGQFTTTIKSFIKNNDNYTELDANNLQTYISEIDNFNHCVTFTKHAIGNTFKFEITKSGVNGTITIEVQVVDGYNVYTADDLSVINNAKDKTTNVEVRGWADKKNGTKYAGLEVNAVVLQKSIKIMKENLPADFFYTESDDTAALRDLTNLSIPGSMKDGDGNGTGGNGRAVYDRILGKDETFSIYGNYFNIDYSALPKCVLESGHEKGVKYIEGDASQDALITTHVTMFMFAGNEKDASGNVIKDGGNLNIYDLNIKGNGKRDNRSLNSGGAMIAKVSHVNSNIENCVYSNAFIGFLFQDYGSDEPESNTENILKDVKGYDSYNTHIYSWGTAKLKIIGGEFKSAGGPVMIVDHVGGSKTDATGGRPSYIDVIGTTMESLVTGKEPWFVSYGASALIPQIVANNNSYVTNGSTFLIKEGDLSNLMNLKVVYKSSSVEGLSAQPVRGYVNFYESSAEYESFKTTEEKSILGLDMTAYSKMSSSESSNKFQNSSNGDMLGSTTYLLYPVNEQQSIVVKFANILALQAAQTQEEQLKYIEGYVGGGVIIWGKDPNNTASAVPAPTTTPMQLNEETTLQSFSVSTSVNGFAALNSNGTTHVNVYMFNGMGITLELYNKDRLNG